MASPRGQTAATTITGSTRRRREQSSLLLEQQSKVYGAPIARPLQTRGAASKRDSTSKGIAAAAATQPIPTTKPSPNAIIDTGSFELSTSNNTAASLLEPQVSQQ